MVLANSTTSLSLSASLSLIVSSLFCISLSTMGCAQSRVDNEEAVARCKDRRKVIKEVVTASKEFAAGHFAYAIALKNADAALSDYGHGESDQTLDAALEKGEEEEEDEVVMRMCEIIKQCLEEDPKNRPSMQQVLDNLNAIART